VLPALAAVQRASGKASLADVIVLAGVVGVEQAARGRRGGGAVHARRAGHARRTDRRRLVRGWSRWPTASATSAAAARRPTEALLIDKAQQLTLTAPEMTVLVGGLRVLGANPTAATTACSPSGRRAQQRLLREPAGHGHGLEGRRRLRRGSKGATGPPARCAGRPRARPGVRLQRGAAGLAEVYASADGQARFVRDFVAAWTKVMNLDRFDLPDEERHHVPARRLLGFASPPQVRRFRQEPD
jgi:catalase-peroxidase